MRDLLPELAWPAAAGNVAWALFTVFTLERPGKHLASRLCILLVLSIYLSVDWIWTKTELWRLKPHYWIADSVHILTIVLLALATQSYT